MSEMGKGFALDILRDMEVEGVRSQVELDRIIDYVEYNPVSPGLAANPGAWRWSSARLAGESACPTIGANRHEM